MRKLLIAVFGLGVTAAHATTPAPYQYSKIMYYQDRAAANAKQSVPTEKKPATEKKQSNEN